MIEAEDCTANNHQALALNLAARFFTARAQLIHQQQVLLQQKAAALGLGIQHDPPHQKLSQMLQIAQFQAYLASLVSNANKTENDTSENLTK